jgi:ATP-dependent Lon protease
MNYAPEVTETGKFNGKMLGLPKYRRESLELQPLCGVVTGLAYTTVGGVTLQVECAALPGAGKLEMTGQLGDVMQESVRAAVSFVRAHALALGVNPDFYKTLDLHIHITEGAVPKDGPSAGVTLVCAIVSALTGRQVRQDVAMTGEITLRGRVLPIGGVKEKLLAAYRAGIKIVLLPQENLRDVSELPEQVRESLDIRTLCTAKDAIETALLSMEPPAQAPSLLIAG